MRLNPLITFVIPPATLITWQQVLRHRIRHRWFCDRCDRAFAGRLDCPRCGAPLRPTERLGATP